MALFTNKTPHVLVIDKQQVEPLHVIDLPDDHPLLSKLIEGGYLVIKEKDPVVIVEEHFSPVEPVEDAVVEEAPTPKKKPGRPKKAKS